MSSSIVYHAYTTSYKGLSNRLINDIELESNGSIVNSIAQWDTGASNTCISEETAKRLSLVPTGMIQVNTPSGKIICYTYLIDILFPNNVTIKDVKVTGTKIGSQGIDVLIGMDVITLGDLAVSNYNGATTFSFRIPSKEKTDYVKEINIQNIISKKHGSGKRKKK